MAPRTADFEYTLSASLVAQSPTNQRDASRLMVVERDSGGISHLIFHEITSLLSPGDALVVNATKVIRARLLGRRESGAPAEIMLLRPLGAGRYGAMVRPGGKLRPGRLVRIAPGFEVEILEITDRRTRVVALRADGPIDAAIERHGHVPLPPYITRADETVDAERYQTVFARYPGSVAAPTAGLHFTPELLGAISARGVRRVELVLHVGAATFKPVESSDLTEHVMHEEFYDLPEDAAAALNATRDGGGRIWAVGTTSARALESVVTEDGRFSASSGATRLFIYPPYRFRGVDKLLTNFHLPRSTLLMLVSAFAGHELTMRAYHEAIDAGYRFYSYGDAMAII